jgi:glycogen operon protein
MSTVRIVDGKTTLASHETPAGRPDNRRVSDGGSAPLGATPSPEGVNFSLFSRHATGVELLLFDRDDDARPARVIPIDPSTHRTYHYWHVFVPGLAPGQLYGYRVTGPFDPQRGLRFDAAKVLLDPYGRGIVVPKGYSREAASRDGDNAATAMKSVVVDPSAYDWEGDRPLRRPAARTIVVARYVPRLPGRHRPLGDRPAGSRLDLSGRGALGSGAARECRCAVTARATARRRPEGGSCD